MIGRTSICSMIPWGGKGNSRLMLLQDPRQFIPPTGQQWTTLNELRKHHENKWQQDSVNEKLWFVTTEPKVLCFRRRRGAYSIWMTLWYFYFSSELANEPRCCRLHREIYCGIALHASMKPQKSLFVYCSTVSYSSLTKSDWFQRRLESNSNLTPTFLYHAHRMGESFQLPYLRSETWYRMARPQRETPAIRFRKNWNHLTGRNCNSLRWAFSWFAGTSLGEDVVDRRYFDDCSGKLVFLIIYDIKLTTV